MCKDLIQEHEREKAQADAINAADPPPPVLLFLTEKSS